MDNSERTERHKIARAHGLPESYGERLRGSSAYEMHQDAADMAAQLPASGLTNYTAKAEAESRSAASDALYSQYFPN